MDGVITTLIGAAPQLGVAGVLLVLLGIVIRWGAQERTDNRAAIAELAARNSAELARVNADHDAELSELRKEIAGLRAQLEEVNSKLDAERERRRAAEDAAMGHVGRHQQGDPPWPQ